MEGLIFRVFLVVCIKGFRLKFVMLYRVSVVLCCEGRVFDYFDILITTV